MSTRFCVTLSRRWNCSAVWLRLPATNRCTSPTDTDRSVSAASRSDRLPSSTLVSVASRLLNDTTWVLLSRSAVTKICRFLMMSTMLPLPSARMRPDAGQLGQGLAQLVAVAVQRVGGAVDEPGHRGVRDLAGRPQIRCQPHQLGLDLVPLDGNRGAVQRDHRAVGHRRPLGPVGRRELDIPRRDQVLGDDHRLCVDRHGHIAVDMQGHLGLGALGFDRVDGADLDAGHPHLVTRVDRRGRGEVRGDGLRAEELRADDERRSRDQQDGQRDGGDGGRVCLRGISVSLPEYRCTGTAILPAARRCPEAVRRSRPCGIRTRSRGTAAVNSWDRQVGDEGVVVEAAGHRLALGELVVLAKPASVVLMLSRLRSSIAVTELSFSSVGASSASLSATSPVSC